MTIKQTRYRANKWVNISNASISAIKTWLLQNLDRSFWKVDSPAREEKKPVISLLHLLEKMRNCFRNLVTHSLRERKDKFSREHRHVCVGWCWLDLRSTQCLQSSQLESQLGFIAVVLILNGVLRVFSDQPTTESIRLLILATSARLCNLDVSGTEKPRKTTECQGYKPGAASYRPPPPPPEYSSIGSAIIISQ